MNPTLTHQSTDKHVQNIVNKTFAIDTRDGWFYPRQVGEPLVRVMVFNGKFLVERKRRPSSAWARLISAAVHEFSEEAFATWQNHWPLVA